MDEVVNIITRMPEKKQFVGVLKGTYGEFNTWASYGNVSGRSCDGKYGYYLSGKVTLARTYVALREPIT